MKRFLFLLAIAAVAACGPISDARTARYGK